MGLTVSQDIKIIKELMTVRPKDWWVRTYCPWQFIHMDGSITKDKEFNLDPSKVNEKTVKDTAAIQFL